MNKNSMVEAESLCELGWSQSHDSIREITDEAFVSFRKAADLGHPQAQAAIGWHYYYGSSDLVVPPDYPEAVKWFLLSAAQNEYLGLKGMVSCLMKGLGVDKDYAEAAKYIMILAADRTNPRYQVLLGDFYYYGLGEVKQNPQEAFRLYQKSYTFVHNPKTIIRLALCFYRGTGVAKNYAEAIRLFKMFIDKGDLLVAEEDRYLLGYCEFLIGLCHLMGQGVAQSDGKAREWFSSSEGRLMTDAMKRMTDYEHQLWV